MVGFLSEATILYEVAIVQSWELPFLYRLYAVGLMQLIIQNAAIALEPLTTHPDEWAAVATHKVVTTVNSLH